LQGKDYNYILDEEYRWPMWAMPKNKEGKLDYHKAITDPEFLNIIS
jgi:type I restriction enzyme M protein